MNVTIGPCGRLLERAGKVVGKDLAAFESAALDLARELIAAGKGGVRPSGDRGLGQLHRGIRYVLALAVLRPEDERARKAVEDLARLCAQADQAIAGRPSP